MPNYCYKQFAAYFCMGSKKCYLNSSKEFRYKIGIVNRHEKWLNKFCNKLAKKGLKCIGYAGVTTYLDSKFAGILQNLKNSDAWFKMVT